MIDTKSYSPQGLIIKNNKMNNIYMRHHLASDTLKESLKDNI